MSIVQLGRLSVANAHNSLYIVVYISEEVLSTSNDIRGRRLDAIIDQGRPRFLYVRAVLRRRGDPFKLFNKGPPICVLGGKGTGSITYIGPCPCL